MPVLPKVSIVCSCFNHENYVIESLNSIVNQTYENIQLIVVDDFSSDNSVEKIKKWAKDFKDVQIIENNKNLGITKSFNNAVRFAKGDFLMDLAADDVLEKNSIEVLVKAFLDSGEENISLIFGNANLINEKGNVTSVVYDQTMMSKVLEATEGNFYEKLLADSTYICSVAGLYNKKIFDQLKGYDDDLFFEDFDYWLRAVKHAKIKFIKNTVINKRVLTNSLGSGFDTDNKYTKTLNISFFHILNKAYKVNTTRKEYFFLLRRIYRHSRWTFQTMNIEYVLRYAWLAARTLVKYFVTNNK